MNYFPIFIDLRNRSILVVGGGEVATRKIKFLCNFGAHIKLIAHHIEHELQKLLETNSNITWISYSFDIKQLNDVFLIIAATDDHQLNKKIFEAANSNYKFINTVDNRKKCSFIFPSIVDRDPLLVAISSNGTAPVLTRLLREKIEALLPNNLGKVADISNQWREKVKKRFYRLSDRRHFWEKAFNGIFFSKILAGQINEAKHFLDQALKNNHYDKGEIILVGAGPGDSGLLTLRGLQVLQSADVILYDHLVSREILNLARRDAKRIYVGKTFGMPSIQQKKINNLLINLAKKNKNVVRLKGGDPFIFGRGAEELEAAYSAGIPFQIVPGITSAVGATAYAGIPLTHRKYSQCVVLITGHSSSNQNIYWPSLIDQNQTLVIYMGTIKIAEIVSKLISCGRDIKTPAAVISRGTYQDQKILIGTLSNLTELVSTVSSPSLLIIGEVVKLHSKLCWFQNIKKSTLLI